MRSQAEDTSRPPNPILALDSFDEIDDSAVEGSDAFTGKSLSEALIFVSTNPQYDDRLFIELQVQ